MDGQNCKLVEALPQKIIIVKGVLFNTYSLIFEIRGVKKQIKIEGYAVTEHLKRYYTVGIPKRFNIIEVLIGEEKEKPIPETITTLKVSKT